MIAYKLFTLRKDGSLGPLFINRKLRIPLDKWLYAEDHPTKGYAHRPGWHVLAEKNAPHLKLNNSRVWAKVEIEEYKEFTRPVNQGGKWYLANKIKVLEVLKCINQF